MTNEETPYFGLGAHAGFGDGGGSEEHRANENENEEGEENRANWWGDRPPTRKEQAAHAMSQFDEHRAPSRELRANRNLVANRHPTLTHADVDAMDAAAVEKLADGIREQLDTPAGGLETYRANQESDGEECTCGHRAHEEEESLDEGEIAAGGYDTYRRNRDGAGESDGDEVAAGGYDAWKARTGGD